MPGTFRYPFDDPETTGFFGGYRRPTTDRPVDAGEYANVMLVSDAVPAANTPRSPTERLTYPNGAEVRDKLGNPYPRPPGLDVQKNIETGQQIGWPAGFVPATEAPINPRDAYMAGLLAAGRPMDYQRPNGYLAAKLYGDIHREYRNVTNYNMGVVAAAAGYSRDEALRGAGLYNRVFNPRIDDTSYGIQQDAVDDITRGYEDYQNGLWKPSAE
ncbi:MAG: hypothetical protein JO128_22700 [Alphaproteobacteria bacterium]|nr:hypothetical protein [Alphaproteobacteria bacterium]